MKAKIISEIFLMAVITGCSTVLVQSDYDREINFTNFHTFDWTTQSENTGSNADQRITLFERRLKKSVDKELTANGFQKQTAERPDFLIAYSIQVEDQVNVLSSVYGYGYGGYSYRGYGPRLLWSRLWPPQVWLQIAVLWCWRILCQSHVSPGLCWPCVE